MRAPEWMSNEMARFTHKLERYKPTNSGYNRIQSIVEEKVSVAVSLKFHPIFSFLLIS